MESGGISYLVLVSVKELFQMSKTLTTITRNAGWQLLLQFIAQEENPGNHWYKISQNAIALKYTLLYTQLAGQDQTMRNSLTI